MSVGYGTMWRLLAVAALLAGCGSDDAAQEATTTTAAETTTTEDVGAYCRLMERTDEAYVEAEESVSPGTLAALVDAEADRIAQAPDELRDEYAQFGKGSVPNEVVDRIKDWTQEHCGFLPHF